MFRLRSAFLALLAASLLIVFLGVTGPVPAAHAELRYCEFASWEPADQFFAEECAAELKRHAEEEARVAAEEANERIKQEAALEARNEKRRVEEFARTSEAEELREAKGVVIRGSTDAALPVAKKLKAKFPHGARLFVNCPGKNTLPDGLACELRTVNKKGSVTGGASVSPITRDGVTIRWIITGLNFGKPQPLAWRRCSLSNLAAESQKPLSLRVFGVSCQEARYLVGDNISYLPLQNSLRLPKRFLVGENGTNTIGFVSRYYRCRSSLRVVHPTWAENPFGRLGARCITKFGDRFAYRFDQFS
jgi:hypothetical protein